MKKIKWSIINGQWSMNQGFTLIELIVVFSVMSILAAAAVASFVSYSNTQLLATATSDVKTALTTARSQASAQVKPASCVGAFQGYEVRICCKGSSGGACPTCRPNYSYDYEIDAICSDFPNGTYIDGSGKTLPNKITFDGTNTTARVYRFLPLSGGVVGGQIQLDGVGSATKTITVTTTGVVQ